MYVNDVTSKDAYPLPRIDTILDTLAGARWFTKLDLLSGYWKVEIDIADKEKTAFWTTEGFFPCCFIHLDCAKLCQHFSA